MNLEKLRDMENPPRIYVIATGAGSTIQTKLWSLPGASKYLVGAQFPYATETTCEVLGYTPEHFVSPETAIGLAQQAYYHALAAKRPGPAVGLGMTCAVASLNERRGERRIITAVITDQLCIYEEFHLGKGDRVGTRERKEDDEAAQGTAMAMLATALGQTVAEDIQPVDGQAMSRKLWFERPVHRHGEHFPLNYVAEDSKQLLFIPGAFNPIHEGHENLIMAASKASGLQPILSITANPPHKPHLTVPQMIAKVRALKGHTVYFNQDPLFIDQARRFPGCSFAIGADAMDCMLDPKWCPVEPMLAEFVKLGTKFYVSSRLVGDRYMDVDAVCAKHGGIDLGYNIFRHVSVPRLDISSTQLREQGKV